MVREMRIYKILPLFLVLYFVTLSARVSLSQENSSIIAPIEESGITAVSGNLLVFFDDGRFFLAGLSNSNYLVGIDASPQSHALITSSGSIVFPPDGDFLRPTVWRSNNRPVNLFTSDTHVAVDPVSNGNEGRFAIFARRATEDFGLPDPTGMDEKNWRVLATARLLATEAAQANPESQPSEGDRIIPAGLARERALQLLKTWQSHIHYIPTFEHLVQKADATLGLTYWARNLSALPRSFGSRAVEQTLLEQLTNQLDHIEGVEALACELERNLQAIKKRQEGFWGNLATETVGWKYLLRLADAASLLVENAEAEQTWKTAMDAIQWHTSRGWQLDQGIPVAAGGA